MGQHQEMQVLQLRTLSSFIPGFKTASALREDAEFCEIAKRITSEFLLGSFKCYIKVQLAVTNYRILV